MENKLTEEELKNMKNTKANKKENPKPPKLEIVEPYLYFEINEIDSLSLHVDKYSDNCNLSLYDNGELIASVSYDNLSEPLKYINFLKGRQLVRNGEKCE